jgi:hypothetical protein
MCGYIELYNMCHVIRIYNSKFSCGYYYIVGDYTHVMYIYIHYTQRLYMFMSCIVLLIYIKRRTVYYVYNILQYKIIHVFIYIYIMTVYLRVGRDGKQDNGALFAITSVRSHVPRKDLFSKEKENLSTITDRKKARRKSFR